MCICCGKYEIYMRERCGLCSSPWWGMWSYYDSEELCPKCFPSEQ